MFAYCTNNPVNFHDPTGLCKNTFSIYFKVDCGSTKCKTSRNYKPALCLVSANGLYGSVNVGAFTLSGALTLAVDTKGNVQVQATAGFDVTSAGSLSASAGMINSWYIAPDISSLLGDAYSLGTSKTIKQTSVPVPLTKGVDVVQTGDGYWGASVSSGVAGRINSDVELNEILGLEVHGGYSYGNALTPKVNVFEIIGSLFKD